MVTAEEMKRQPELADLEDLDKSKSISFKANSDKKIKLHRRIKET